MIDNYDRNTGRYKSASSHWGKHAWAHDKWHDDASGPDPCKRQRGEWASAPWGACGGDWRGKGECRSRGKEETRSRAKEGPRADTHHWKPRWEERSGSSSTASNARPQHRSQTPASIGRTIGSVGSGDVRLPRQPARPADPAANAPAFLEYPTSRTGQQLGGPRLEMVERSSTARASTDAAPDADAVPVSALSLSSAANPTVAEDDDPGERPNISLNITPEQTGYDQNLAPGPTAQTDTASSQSGGVDQVAAVLTVVPPVKPRATSRSEKNERESQPKPRDNSEAGELGTWPTGALAGAAPTTTEELSDAAPTPTPTPTEELNDVEWGDSSPRRDEF